MTTKFRPVLYYPNGGRIGPLLSPIGYSFSSPFNEVSSAEFSYRPNMANYNDLLTPVELAFEASKDGISWQELPNARYIRLSREYEKIGPLNTRKFAFTGYGWQLKKVLQWRTDNLNADGKRPFLSATVGTIVKTLLDEGHNRGAVPGLTYDFSTDKDSSGQAWDKVITIYYEPGLNLYTILDNLSQQGMCDWRMMGRKLQLFNADTSLGSTKPAKLKPGVDLKALPVKGSIENLVSDALVIGDEGRAISLNNPSAPMPWGRWETSISNGGVSDPTTMQILGNTLLEDNGQEKIQYTGEVKTDTTTYFPFFDFEPGDYITGPGESKDYVSYRVRGINVSQDSAGKQQIDLILNDRFVEREIRNAKKTNGITGGATAGGSGGRPTTPGAIDTRVPKAPTGLVVDSSAYIENGQPRAQVVMHWSPVTEATDNTAIEDLQYSVEYRLNGGSDTWKSLSTTLSPELSYAGLPVGTAYQFRVRAISKAFISSGYSATVSHTTAVEDTAPPAPSKPVLTSKLGTVTVRWNGKTKTNGAMPLDFDRINVWRQGSQGSELVGTIMGSAGGFIVVTGLAISLQTFWFTAVDTSGNEGQPSDQESIMVVRVSGPDLEANSVTTNELAAGAVTAVNIATEALQTKHLAVGVIRNNLVKNGDFEDTGLYPPPQVRQDFTSIPGWTYEARSATPDYFRYLDMANTRTGRGCVVLRQGTALDNGARIISDPIPVVAGQEYRVNIPFKTSHAVTSSVGLRYHWSTDGGVTYNSVSGGYASNTGLGYYSIWYWLPTAPAGATHIKLEIFNRGDGVFSNTTNAIVVDGVSFLARSGPSMEITPGGIRFFNANGDETINIDGAGATLSAGTLNGVQVNATGGVKVLGPGGIQFGTAGTARMGYGTYRMPDNNIADIIESEGHWRHGYNSPTWQNDLEVYGPIACELDSWTGSANVLSNSSPGNIGNLWRVTSLSRFKLDQRGVGLHYPILDLEPKTWIDRRAREEDPEFNQRFAGFIAEELEELSNQHDKVFEPIISRQLDGTLQGIAYDRIVAYLLPIIRDMNNRLKELEK